MKNFIQLISHTSKDIIYQLINEEIETNKIETNQQLKLQETISVVSGFTTKNSSVQISISFSQELVKKISSRLNDGMPIVTIDSESKRIVMEISKLIISNSVIFLEGYDDLCVLSQPFIIEGSNTIYSSGGVVTYIDLNLMNEQFNIAIFQSHLVECDNNMKMIEKNIYS